MSSWANRLSCAGGSQGKQWFVWELLRNILMLRLPLPRGVCIERGVFKELFVCLSIRGILSEFIEHIFFASELLLFENCTFSNASAGLRGGNNT
jgi:hypothetical protein